MFHNVDFGERDNSQSDKRQRKAESLNADEQKKQTTRIRHRQTAPSASASTAAAAAELPEINIDFNDPTSSVPLQTLKRTPSTVSRISAFSLDLDISTTTATTDPSRASAPSGVLSFHNSDHASSSASGIPKPATMASRTPFLAEDDGASYGTISSPESPPQKTGIFSDNLRDSSSLSGEDTAIDIDPDDDALSLENSPYEAVRAAVLPTDDLALSINTPRMWCLSILFSILGSSTNLFFSLRYPSVAITPVIALLLAHPLGILWDLFLKHPEDPQENFEAGVLTSRFAIPTRFNTRWHQLRLYLAQGRWNEKEHTCVYVSSNVAFGFAFATDVIVEQSKFYHQEVTLSYQLLLTFSTQILGYAFAGLTRKFLVRPSSMIWPGTLMSAAMFGTLHKEENKPADGWRISRWRFFAIVWIGGCLFYFLPGLLFPVLSYFNVITWFAPKNVIIANLFGVVSGLGLFPMTFDWAQITYIGSPLLVPFWAAMNVVGGVAIVMWLLAPLMYYANVLYSAHMPILSASVFDNTGAIYDVSRILTKDFVFDREAYSNYSRVFLPITYVLSYGVQFAGLASLLSHTLCWYGPDIWRTWKMSLQEAKVEDADKPDYQPVGGEENRTSIRPVTAHNSQGNRFIRDDIHSRLMKRYDDAPLSWYLITFVTMVAIGIFVVEYYPVHLPWWGLLLSLSICALFFIPNGIVMAVTNQHSSIYLICQLVCGVIFPGRPVANMLFVTYGYISSAQGIKFASDLKLGHYMKIPPRLLFRVQMAATLLSSCTQISVLNWMFKHIPNICTPDAINGFSCPFARVHFNGSILWGVVGPSEFFGRNALYRPLIWFFPLGLLLPIPLYLYARRKPSSLLRKVNFPVILGTMAWIPPATGLNFSMWAVVCYIFNYHIRRRAGAWWAKYTMTLSAALDSGLALGIVVVFFGVVYPGWMEGFKWWGTEVYKQGCDWKGCPYMEVPEEGRFGPPKW